MFKSQRDKQQWDELAAFKTDPEFSIEAIGEAFIDSQIGTDTYEGFTSPVETVVALSDVLYHY